ncbi:MAG: HEAT repeat domain-containing protein [Planctomycetes bacterium]|nr:HEAT repeat domain-containing protein [Planctomycetota bacterium]
MRAVVEKTRSVAGAVRFLTVALAIALWTATAYAHGGEFYKPPPPEKKLKPKGPDTPRGGTATAPDDVPGPTTGSGGDKLGADDWKSWWTTQRSAFVRTRIADVETPTSAAPSGPTERDEVLAALRKAVEDDDDDVSTSALVALGRVGDRASEATMIRVLGDERRTQAVRESAACGLAFLGRAKSDAGAARAALESVLLRSEGVARLRAIAAYAIGLRGETESVEVLAALALTARTDTQVASASAAALGLVGTDDATAVLTRLLEKGRDGDDDPAAVRVYAAQGLARSAATASVAALRKAAADADPDVRRASALALGALAGATDDDTQRSLRRILDQDREPACRDAALIALGRQGHAASKRVLEDAVAGGRRVHPTYAVTALGLWAKRTGDPSAAAPVRAFLTAATDPVLRSAACFAVAVAHDRDAAPVVLRIAEARNDPWLRAVAIAAIPSLVPREEAAPLLLRLLDAAEPPEIRREAASALGVLGEVSATPILSDLVETGDRLYVRSAATVALGRVGGPGAATRLRTTLTTPGREGMLRGLAAVGLGLLLQRERTQPLHLVADDLNWDFMTDAVAELMSIL